ncbi:efflux RND transporter periplasmic adaptor subunit [Marinicella sp. W31]|uniref:efflux RND transporter periplasmic adaptor subunit n=1 Tax=Marinicella sp. W31 TaxID=3023713 RepID=UPI003756C6FF
MKKRLLITPVMCALLITACTSESPDNTVKNQSPQLKTVTVKKQQQFKTHALPAFTKATDNAFLAFQISGTIDRRLVQLGDTVEKGDVLMTIYNPQLGPQIDNFLGQINSVNANIKQTENEVNRLKNLRKTNAVSQNDLDRLVNQRKSLIAQRESLKAQLANAKALNAESVLTAPFSGSIADVVKDEGEVVAPGDTVLVLGGLDALETAINLPARLHRNIVQGQTLTLDYLGTQISASVKEISLTAHPNTQLFTVMLDVPIQNGIKSGERVLIQLEESLGEVYQLPLQAVVDDGVNAPYIYINADKTVEKLSVHIDSIIDDSVNVHLPIDTPIEVIVQGQHQLKSGTSVASHE